MKELQRPNKKQLLQIYQFKITACFLSIFQSRAPTFNPYHFYPYWL